MTKIKSSVRNTGKKVFASEHVEQYRNTKVIIQSQAWGMSLTGSVSGAVFQLCLYFVSIKKKMTEGVKLKVAVIQAWLSIIQCWPCLLKHAYILPPGSCLVHTVPLAAVQQLHMISYQAHVYSFFPRVHSPLKVFSDEFKMNFNSEFVCFAFREEFMQFAVKVVTFRKHYPLLGPGKCIKMLLWLSKSI